MGLVTYSSDAISDIFFTDVANLFNMILSVFNW